jgi:putative N6-adenine-specific DNA methylase
MHDAPLKENLAAGLVLLSNWRFSEPFYDPFCGSGTIAIEAAMIARNIAPGSLGRKFAITRFPWFPREILSNARQEAKDKILTGKKYTIIASDVEEEYLDMTYAHAQNAGVADDIEIVNRNFLELLAIPLSGTLVGNPPYGVRLQPEELNELYLAITKVFDKNEKLTGGIITSFEEAGKIFTTSKFKNRKLYNG